ncbi:hypothetical protein ACUTFX_09330 [Enterobacter hormaechei]|uniref:hypothetical protein n=1 Tax=Enterobacter hormaechei TaxID=158836 RepID=UPI0025B69258|nr:hypothetical protein [uncultured Escherichia sp.]HAV1678375.1 hypothetical protein [Enterobacter hormaechei subsp. steigerwaltii]HAV1944789.1 hypothetical protein [Enterobacter hormaechei subsp. steigerwaltii]HEM7447816.1 hypothetical protein [Enterobacter hormaechei]
MKRRFVFILLFFSFSKLVFANTELNEFVNSVRSVCTNPGSQGQKWDIQVLASGDVNVGLKLFGKANADAKVEFTKSEWEGVQQVLKEQQQKDNENYRECVKYITPKFMDKLNQQKSISSSGDNENVAELKLPISVIGGGERVVFSPNFIMAIDGYFSGGDGHRAQSTVNTPENGRLTLNAGVPVNVSFKGKNYLLVFEFNKYQQPVYTLMNQ